VTVYICEKVDGEDTGQRAIMKIRAEYVRLGERKHGASIDTSRIPGTHDLEPSSQDSAGRNSPPENPTPEDLPPKDRQPTTTNFNPLTIHEITCLKRLTKAGCRSTPHLLGYECLNRKGDQWLPKGYVVFILMQLVPGVSLVDFWELSRRERDEARTAFRTALE